MTDVRKALGALVVSLLALSIVWAPPAAADTVGDEAAFVAKLNDLRASQGLGSLAPNSALTTVARTWSATMSAAGAISHNPSLASMGPSNWARLGENVGMGMDVQGLHVAFMNSPTHYRNMVDGSFDSVGVGVVHHSDGTIFVTVNFMTTRAAPAPAAPAPAPAATPAPAPAPAAPPAPARRPAPAPAPPASVATPAPAPVAEPAPAPAPAPVDPAPVATPASAPEPVSVAPSAPPVTVLANRATMVTIHNATDDSSSRTALALVGVGLLLTVAASALVVPRRTVKVPSLARRI